jgi:hypothetical protein
MTQRTWPALRVAGLVLTAVTMDTPPRVEGDSPVPEDGGVQRGVTRLGAGTRRVNAHGRRRARGSLTS